MMRPTLLLLPLLALCACAGDIPGGPRPYNTYLQKYDLPMPSGRSFEHCRGYGCTYRDPVTFSKTEWRQVRNYFNAAASPRAERNAIAKSIGYLERQSGKKTGTSGDIAGTFTETGDYQLDCVDESSNTTLYLIMMEQDKLLKHHRVSAPAIRTAGTAAGNGFLWPHQSAVIFENKSSTGYAVDSWYRNNGAPADIVALDEWAKGWEPE